jgi:hypothetical protein
MIKERGEQRKNWITKQERSEKSEERREEITNCKNQMLYLHLLFGKR